MFLLGVFKLCDVQDASWIFVFHKNLGKRIDPTPHWCLSSPSLFPHILALSTPVVLTGIFVTLIYSCSSPLVHLLCHLSIIFQSLKSHSVKLQCGKTQYKTARHLSAGSPWSCHPCNLCTNGSSLPVLLSADNVSGKESNIVGWVQSFTDSKPSLSLSQHLASVHNGLVMEKVPSFSLLLFPSNQRVFAGLSGLQAHVPSKTLQSLDAAVSMCVSLALHQTACFCPEST